MPREDTYFLIAAVIAVLAAIVTYVVLHRHTSGPLQCALASSVAGMLIGVFWPITLILATLALVAFVVGSLYEGLQWFGMWLANKLGAKNDG